MELTKREKKFLVAAIKAAPNKGDTFNRYEVGEPLGYGKTECDDLARHLEQKDLLRRLQNHHCELTHGREAAKQLIDDAIAERWSRVWKALHWTWGIAVTLMVAWLTAKIQATNTPPPQPTTQVVP